MSIELVECWKYQATADLPGQLTSVAGNAAVTDGELALGSTSGTQANFTFSGALGTVYINARIRLTPMTTTDATFILFRLMDGATNQCGLAVRLADMKLFFFRNTSATQIGADSGIALTSGVEYDLEIKFVINTTGSGKVELKINGSDTDGIPEATVNNRNTANNQATSMQIGLPGSTAGIGLGRFRVLHLIVMNTSGSEMNGHIGVVNVNVHRPSGVGDSAQWTRGGSDEGENYLQVDDDTPDNDSTYVGSGTATHLDTYQIEDMPAGVTTIHAVGVLLRARRDDAAARQVKSAIRYSGVNYLGDAKSLSSSYNSYVHWWTVNPGTEAAFTVSEFNALEAGPYVEA